MMVKVLERKHHQPSSVCSLENTDGVRVALQRSPSKSTRKAAAQLGISRQSLQRILKSDLNLYPYKMTVLPKLTVQNKHMAFAGWAQNNEVSFNNVWFSDDAHLHTKCVIFGIRESKCDSGEGTSCTENYSMGCHLNSWTARAIFL
jgi:hypothetical protein